MSVYFPTTGGAVFCIVADRGKESVEFMGCTQDLARDVKARAQVQQARLFESLLPIAEPAIRALVERAIQKAPPDMRLRVFRYPRGAATGNTGLVALEGDSFEAAVFLAYLLEAFRQQLKGGADYNPMIAVSAEVVASELIETRELSRKYAAVCSLAAECGRVRFLFAGNREWEPTTQTGSDQVELERVGTLHELVRIAFQDYKLGGDSSLPPAPPVPSVAVARQRMRWLLPSLLLVATAGVVAMVAWVVVPRPAPAPVPVPSVLALAEPPRLVETPPTAMPTAPSELREPLPEAPKPPPKKGAGTTPIGGAPSASSVLVTSTPPPAVPGSAEPLAPQPPPKTVPSSETERRRRSSWGGEL